MEGSTRLLQTLGERYHAVLADHHRLLRAAFREAGGREVDAAGDGLFYAFPSARDALLGAMNGQRAILAHPWPEATNVRVRMGLHTGEAISGELGYVGIDVHRAARISSAGHGGQILLSQTTRDLVGDDAHGDIRLVDLGEHQLKDLPAPERLYQVVVEGLLRDFPALRSIDARPNNLPRQLTSFIGRQNEISEIKRILGSAPLLTLTGPGGVGKTRLALEIGGDLLEDFDGGAWFVELAALSDPAFVLQAVASSLGVGEEPGRPLLSTIVDHLRARRCRLRRNRRFVAPRQPDGPPPRDQPGGSGDLGRSVVPGSLAVLAGGRPQECRRAQPVRRRPALRGARDGRISNVPRHGRQRRSDRPDLPPSGWCASGDRAGRGARPRPHARPDRCSTG